MRSFHRDRRPTQKPDHHRPVEFDQNPDSRIASHTERAASKDDVLDRLSPLRISRLARHQYGVSGPRL